jgi:hypothetical protein
MAGINGFDNVTMTIPATVLSDFGIMGFDADGLVKPTRGERPGMSHAVAKLRQILSEEIFRRMAVVTNCCVPVARSYPAGQLLLHDMTVCARFRTVGEIRSAFGIDESKAADTDGQSDDDRRKHQ